MSPPHLAWDCADQTCQLNIFKLQSFSGLCGEIPNERHFLLQQPTYKYLCCWVMLVVDVACIRSGMFLLPPHLHVYQMYAILEPCVSLSLFSIVLMGNFIIQALHDKN